MAEVSRFEDLIAWQKARILTPEIYSVTQQGAFAKGYGLANQLQRVTLSIMSNITEGFERGGRGEFHQFLVIAKASCAEVRSQLYVALDTGSIHQEQFNNLINLAQEVSRIVGGLRASVKRQWDQQSNN